MWKIVVGFLVIAALAIWLLSKGGDVDISGEKHSVEVAPAATAASAGASAPAAAPMPASAPASAASTM